jgi:hypothetical protein
MSKVVSNYIKPVVLFINGAMLDNTQSLTNP